MNSYTDHQKNSSKQKNRMWQEVHCLHRSWDTFLGRLYAIHQKGAFFVTRAKRNLKARRLYSAKVVRSEGVICDQIIMLEGINSKDDYPEHLRRVRFKDPKTGKTLIGNPPILSRSQK